MRGLSTHASCCGKHRWGEGAFLDLSYSIPILYYRLLAVGRVWEVYASLQCAFFTQRAQESHPSSRTKSKRYFVGWHSLRREGYLVSVEQPSPGLQFWRRQTLSQNYACVYSFAERCVCVSVCCVCVSECMLYLCTCVGCVCVHICMQQFICAILAIGVCVCVCVCVCPYVSATINTCASWCCVYVCD